MITEAAELEDPDQARVEAAMRIALMLDDHARKLWADENWQMAVKDENGFDPVRHLNSRHAQLGNQ